MPHSRFHHLRSVLYAPCDKPRILGKLAGLACAAVILDCEDAVAPEAKAAARDGAAAFLSGARPPMPLILRVNALESGLGADDLAMAAAALPDAVLIPKVETARDLAQAAGILDAAGAPALPLWAMIESPRAFLEIAAIAAAAPGRLAAFVLGTNDLAKAMRLPAAGARRNLHPLIMLAAAAARAHGLAIYDGVLNTIDDEAALAAECADGRAMGLDGKTLIHPAQIAAANAAFAPSDAEIAWAEAVVDAFAAPENAGRGAMRLEGGMVERLHLDEARALLARRR